MRRGRGRRIRNSVSGFVNSGVRSLSNLYFIICSIAFYFIQSTANSLDWLYKILTSIKLNTAASWLKQHHDQSSAILYVILVSFTCLPSNLSLFYTVVASIFIYYKDKLTVTTYIVLVFFLTWFARTRSPKIKIFIAAAGFASYYFGWWGADLQLIVDMS